MGKLTKLLFRGVVNMVHKESNNANDVGPVGKIRKLQTKNTVRHEDTGNW